MSRWNFATLALVIALAGAVGCKPASTVPVSANGTNAPDSPATPSPAAGSESPLPVADLDESGAEALAKADALATAGQSAAAEKAYREFLKQHPDNEEAHFSLGFLLAKAGQTNDAVHHYQEAIRVLPTYSEAHNNLGNLFVRMKRFEDAIRTSGPP